jgi:hypothetical protein
MLYHYPLRVDAACFLNRFGGSRAQIQEVRG